MLAPSAAGSLGERASAGIGVPSVREPTEYLMVLPGPASLRTASSGAVADSHRTCEEPPPSTFGLRAVAPITAMLVAVSPSRGSTSPLLRSRTAPAAATLR